MRRNHYGETGKSWVHPIGRVSLRTGRLRGLSEVCLLGSQAALGTRQRSPLSRVGCEIEESRCLHCECFVDAAQVPRISIWRYLPNRHQAPRVCMPPAAFLRRGGGLAGLADAHTSQTRTEKPTGEALLIATKRGRLPHDSPSTFCVQIPERPSRAAKSGGQASSLLLGRRDILLRFLGREVHNDCRHDLPGGTGLALGRGV